MSKGNKQLLRYHTAKWTVRAWNMLRFLPVIFFSISCLTPSRFIANKSLVKPWTTKLAQSAQEEAPYIAKFQKQGKLLIYVAAAHHYGIDSHTFTTIKQAISRFKPQVIIVEGAANLDHGARQGILDQVVQCEAASFRDCQENLYSIYVAKREGIAWVSGEPEESLIHASLVKQGYNKSDIAFFYLVRQVKQLIAEKQLSEQNFERIANTTLNNFSASCGLPKGLSAETFLSWYKEKMHHPFVLAEIDSETTAPIIAPTMTYLNRISAAINKIRDEAIIENVAEQLNKQQRVMVVYGSSHLLSQLDALSAMLGQPLFTVF